MVYIPQSASMVPRFQQSHDWSTANLSVLQQSDYRSKLHVQLQDADVCNADGIADLTAWKQLEQNVVHCMICQNKYQRYDFRTLQRHTTNKTYGNKTETVTLSKQTQISYYSYYLLLLTNSSTKITSTILELFLSLFSAMKFHDFCRAAAYCPPDCATSLSQASGHGERMNQILQCSGYGLISMMLVDTCLMFFCHSMNIYGHHQYIYVYICVYIYTIIVMIMIMFIIIYRHIYMYIHIFDDSSMIIDISMAMLLFISSPSQAFRPFSTAAVAKPVPSVSLPSTTADLILARSNGAWGIPNSWRLCEGQTQSKMDDDRGYPYFRKPPIKLCVCIYIYI